VRLWELALASADGNHKAARSPYRPSVTRKLATYIDQVLALRMCRLRAPISHRAL
jgi:hypothetical protein